ASVLRQCRRAAGLTQEGLAERAKLSVRGLSDLERGARTRPYQHTLGQLIQALGLTAGEAERFREAARRQKAAPASSELPEAPFLSSPPTALIGREGAIAAASALLGREDVRLLTLTGPPGVGKTRLALELAQRLQEHSANQVVFVALASVRNPDM